MSLFKFFSLIGRGATKCRIMVGNIGRWSRFYSPEKYNQAHVSKLKTVNLINVHERNGSRGEGLGMGHRKNRTNKRK